MHDSTETGTGVGEKGEQTAIVREERAALGGREIHGDGHNQRERERERERERGLVIPRILVQSSPRFSRGRGPSFLFARPRDYIYPKRTCFFFPYAFTARSSTSHPSPSPLCPETPIDRRDRKQSTPTTPSG